MPKEELVSLKRKKNNTLNINININKNKTMDKYDKKMMHERELIYDAKKQAKRYGGETAKNDKKLIYDAKGAIHRTDMEKKGGHPLSKHWHNNR